MKNRYILPILLMLLSLNAEAKTAGYYCKAHSLRAYQDLSKVTDSTGKAVVHAGPSQNGERVVLIGGTHIVIELSHQDADNQSSGAFFALQEPEKATTPGEGYRRLNGWLTFDGGYGVNIQVLEMEGQPSSFLTAQLVRSADVRIIRILGKHGQEISEGPVSVGLFNLDVDNAWLGIRSNYYEDGKFQQLATMISNGTVADGVLVNVTVECTPK